MYVKGAYTFTNSGLVPLLQNQSINICCLRRNKFPIIYMFLNYFFKALFFLFSFFFCFFARNSEESASFVFGCCAADYRHTTLIKNTPAVQTVLLRILNKVSFSSYSMSLSEPISGHNNSRCVSAGIIICKKYLPRRSMRWFQGQYLTTMSLTEGSFVMFSLLLQNSLWNLKVERQRM